MCFILCSHLVLLLGWLDECLNLLNSNPNILRAIIFVKFFYIT